MDARLANAGLTDREIRVMALYYADRCKLSEIGLAFDPPRTKSWACKVIKAAVAKLRKAGLPVPRRTGDGVEARPRILTVDPHTLDLLPSGS